MSGAAAELTAVQLRSYREHGITPIGGVWTMWVAVSLVLVFAYSHDSIVIAQSPEVSSSASHEVDAFAKPWANAQRLIEWPPSETWQVIMDGDSPVGHSVTRCRRVSPNRNQPVQLEWSQSTQLTINRFGDVSTQEIRLTSIEHLDGSVVSCTALHVDGPQQTTVSGSSNGDSFCFQIGDPGKIQSVTVDQTKSVRGFFALEQSLAAQPMQPAEIRALRCWLPLSTSATDLTLTAGGLESTELLQGKSQLLRVDGQMRMGPQQVLEFSCWQGPDGQIPKMHVPATGQTTFLTTQEVALQPTHGPDQTASDLGRSSLIPVSFRSGDGCVDPHAAVQMKFRVRAQRGSLKNVFSETNNQLVRYRSDRSVILTLCQEDSSELTQGVEPTIECLRANHWIDFEDEVVMGMSQSVAGDERDPKAVAHMLAAHVHGFIEQKDFGRGFDTASAVARNRQGDCTEHAVLLVALCRARQIPARIAFGLVFLNDRRSFAFHAWTEVWVDGQWIGLDSSRDRDRLGCGHIKVGESDLANTTAPAAMLPLAQLLGKQLTMDILAE